MKVIIDHNPHIALSDLKELFRLSEGSASFTANGVQYTIVFSLEKQICVFLWEYNGKKKQEKKHEYPWKNRYVILAWKMGK